MSSSSPQDRTLAHFIAGIEFAAKWHETRAQIEEEKQWTERARDHRDHAQDLRDLIHKLEKP